jgi:hypothetical protein
MIPGAQGQPPVTRFVGPLEVDIDDRILGPRGLRGSRPKHHAVFEFGGNCLVVRPSGVFAR